MAAKKRKSIPRGTENPTPPPPASLADYLNSIAAEQEAAHVEQMAQAQELVGLKRQRMSAGQYVPTDKRPI